MSNDLQTIRNALRGNVVNIQSIDPKLKEVRLSAHQFACEFWEDVFDRTSDDMSVMYALYTTFAVLIERQKLYQVAFDLLYGYHLAYDADTCLPAREVGDNPKLVGEFMKVFLLFSQIILEGYSEDLEEDTLADFFAFDQ